MRHLKGIAAIAVLLVSATLHAEQIENPHFTCWASFKPGTGIVVRFTQVSPHGKLATLTTFTLDSVADDECVVSSLVTSENGQKRARPGTPEHIRRRIENDADLKALAAGKLTSVTVPAGTFKASTFKIDASIGGVAERHVEAWFALDVPGGVVKDITTMTAARFIKTTELMAIHKK